MIAVPAVFFFAMCSSRSAEPELVVRVVGGCGIAAAHSGLPGPEQASNEAAAPAGIRYFWAHRDMYQRIASCLDADTAAVQKQPPQPMQRNH